MLRNAMKELSFQTVSRISQIKAPTLTAQYRMLQY